MPNEEAPPPAENSDAASQLAGMLDGLEPDQYGIYRLDQHQTAHVEQALSALGILANQPTDAEVSEMASGVRGFLGSPDQAAIVLSGLSFMPEDEVGRLIGVRRARVVSLSSPLYMAPRSIAGAAGFNSWAGRGHLGNGPKESDGERVTSAQAIYDYASRDTPLPTLGIDGGFDLVTTDDGQTVVYSSNSHRSAAAKLRQEPLGFDVFRFYA